MSSSSTSCPSSSSTVSSSLLQQQLQQSQEQEQHATATLASSSFLGGADAGQRASSGFGFYTEVPTDDVCRLSFYLKCCVLGCDISLSADGYIIRVNPDNHQQLLPLQLFDYNNAHQLPLEWQHLIFQLALHGFRLDKVLNKYVFVDDDHLVMSDDLANMFLQVNSSHERATLSTLIHHQQQSRASASLPPIQLPPNGQKVMICSSLWLTEIYLDPCKRYQQTLMKQALLSSLQVPFPTPILESPSTPPQHHQAPPSTNVNSGNNGEITATGQYVGGFVNVDHPSIMCDQCSVPGITGCRYRCTVCEDYDLCSSCYHHGPQDHEHVFECIECETSTPQIMPCVRQRRPVPTPTTASTTTRTRSSEEDTTNDKKRKYEDITTSTTTDIIVEDVPMVDAVPILQTEDEHGFTDILDDEDNVSTCGQDGYSGHPDAELYIPGQVVRLTGLEGTDPALNDVLAVVEHRVKSKVLVRIECDDDSDGWVITVKPENLIVLGNVIS